MKTSLQMKNVMPVKHPNYIFSLILGGVGCAYYWYIPVHIIFGKYSMLVSRLLFPSKIKVLYI